MTNSYLDSHLAVVKERAIEMGTKSAQRNKVIPKAFRYFCYLQDVINHYIHPIKTNNKNSKTKQKSKISGTLKTES